MKNIHVETPYIYCVLRSVSRFEVVSKSSRHSGVSVQLRPRSSEQSVSSCLYVPEKKRFITARRKVTRMCDNWSELYGDSRVSGRFRDQFRKLEAQGPCTGHRSIIAILYCFSFKYMKREKGRDLTQYTNNNEIYVD